MRANQLRLLLASFALATYVLARDLPLGAWITASEKMTCSPDWGIIYRVDIKSPDNAAGINRLVFWKGKNKQLNMVITIGQDIAHLIGGVPIRHPGSTARSRCPSWKSTGP